MYIQSPDGAQSMVWICLYTLYGESSALRSCARHVFLTFLRSFKQIAARRGLPTCMISDNGKTFKAATKTILAVLSHKDVERYFFGLGVKWVFNIPKAPWRGGIFEGMVRSAKWCLRRILGQAKLSYNELLTALTEVEMVLNS